MLLLLLGACSSNGFEFPWQSKQSPSSVNLIEPNQDATSKTSKPTSIIPGKSAPRQVPLETSNLPIATDDDLEQCRNLLGLPAEIDAMADSTNFGDRHAVDQWGRPLVASPQIIVLHETVLDEEATINLFQTPHPNDNDQVSYHMLVGLDGSRLRIVPDVKRAFGAGMSAFGDVTQRTKLGSVGSINNMALHISLVTPTDGRGNTPSHSGYTDAQYKTLAEQVLLWQAKFGIPFTR